MKNWEDMSVYEQNCATYSDMYKDVYGVRPRAGLPKTEAEFEVAFAFLQREIEAQMNSDAAMEQEYIQRFNETIDTAIESGAKDRATALRWLTQTENFYSKQCIESYVYDLGFLFTDFGKSLVDELEGIVVYKDFGTEEED